MADCIPKKFAKTTPRIYVEDLECLLDIKEQLDARAEKRDGYLKRGMNKSTLSDAIHQAVLCFKELGLQSPQKKICEFSSAELVEQEA